MKRYFIYFMVITNLTNIIQLHGQKKDTSDVKIQYILPPDGGCTINTYPSNINLGFCGGISYLSVAVDDGCLWSASKIGTWFTISPTRGDSYISDIIINYTTNTSTTSRSGSITVSGVKVTITQYGTPLVYTVSGIGNKCTDYAYILKLSGSQTGITYRVYRDNVLVPGLNKTGNGSALSWTAQLYQPGTYKIKAYHLGCEKEMNDSVTINPTPSISSIITASSCGPDTVRLEAFSNPGNAIIKWYNVSGIYQGTGNIFQKFVSETTNYYVDATLGGCTTPNRTLIKAYVLPIPSSYMVSGGGCTSGEQKQISLSGSQIGPYYSLWRDGVFVSETEGNGGAIHFYQNNTGSYTIKARDLCTKDMEGSAIIKPNPVITGIQPDEICGSGVVNLGATSSGGNINWYTNPTEGNAINIGDTYSPTISISTTYYVSAISEGCSSVDRIPVSGIVKYIPSIPEVTSEIHCGPMQVHLIASTNDGSIINWFSDLSSGIPIYTGQNFSPNISSTTTFYLASNLSGCNSERISVIARIPNQIAIDARDIGQDATCTISGIVMETIFTNESTINVYPETIPGYGILKIIDDNSDPVFIKFQVDECFTISDVRIKIDDLYVPLFGGFYSITKDPIEFYSTLKLKEIEKICIYYPN